jgi:hypothetical protein
MRPHESVASDLFRNKYIDTDSNGDEVDDRHQDKHDEDSPVHQMMVPFGLAVLELIPRRLFLFHNYKGVFPVRAPRAATMSYRAKLLSQGFNFSIYELSMGIAGNRSDSKPLAKDEHAVGPLWRLAQFIGLVPIDCAGRGF